MKLYDWFAFVLIISCSVLSMIQAFIFADSYNLNFPKSNVIAEIIVFCLIYLFPRYLFFVPDMNFSKISSDKLLYKLLYLKPDSIKRNALRVSCVILIIIAINTLINIINLAKNDPQTVRELKNYYEGFNN